MHYMNVCDIIAQLQYVDDPDAAGRAKTDSALKAALSLARPSNWWGTGANQSLLVPARDDGLPLSWIPRADTIKALNAGTSRLERITVLMDRHAEVVEDCATALDECDEDEIVDTVYLARCAVDALVEGHHEAAMALAVSMAEPLAQWASTPRVRSYDSAADEEQWEKQLKSTSKYKHAGAEIDRLAPGTVSPWEFCWQVLIAPIPTFFAEWWPESTIPPPTKLSRHVVAHLARRDQFTQENALLAIMLVVSILREQQEWALEVRIDDARGDVDVDL